MAEEKEETEKMPEGEMVHVLESERDAKGWNGRGMARSSAYS